MEVSFFAAYAGFYLVVFGAAYVWESAHRAVQSITDEL
jgi:hypothetical protein